MRTPPSQVLTHGDPNLALLDGGVGRERREKLPPTSSTHGRVELRHRAVFESGTGIEREQQQGLFTKKSLACSTPPGTFLMSLMTTD